MAASGKGIVADKKFLEYQRYLREEAKFLNINKIESTPSHLNEEGIGEILYRATVPNHEISSREIKTLKEISNTMGFFLKVFKLEEIV
ncbi:MAG: hypothetical protein AABW56_01670 [Nanoarchaeota archaeon]